MDKENIVLVSFFGINTKEIAAVFADTYEMLGCDTDELIAYQFAEIPKVLELFGTEGYEKYEKMAIKGAGSYSNTVISAGSTTMNCQLNIERLKANGILVYLHGDLKKMHKNISEKDKWFLPKGSFNEFMEKYKPQEEAFKTAPDISVNIDGLSNEEIVKSISKKLLELTF